MFSSSKLQYSRLYFPFIDEITEICIKSKFSEKCSNTDRRAGAKLYRPNLTAVDHSILRVRERVPIFTYLSRRDCERGLVLEYLLKGIVTFDFVLGHKSSKISLKFSKPRFLTAKQENKLMAVDIYMKMGSNPARPEIFQTLFSLLLKKRSMLRRLLSYLFPNPQFTYMIFKALWCFHVSSEANNLANEYRTLLYGLLLPDGIQSFLLLEATQIGLYELHLRKYGFCYVICSL